MNEKVTHNDDGTVLLSLTPKIVGKSLMPAEVMTTLYRVKSRNGACFLGASIKTTSNPLNSDNAVHQQAFDITNEVFLNENDMLIAVSEIKIGDFRMPKSYSRTIGMPTHEGQIGIFESGCSSFVESK
ncbi:MAG: hypothetical protein COA78_35740 [Blastopirellula sp.]|nr:MAG: hypothetical protein COA78_35740 [Blastopirellula sp.]